MQKIGIIGGLGPEATADYYKRIVGFFHEYNQSLSAPEIIIYSIDIAELFKFVSEQRWEPMAEWLASKVAALKFTLPQYVRGALTLRSHCAFDNDRAAGRG